MCYMFEKGSYTYFMRHSTPGIRNLFSLTEIKTEEMRTGSWKKHFDLDI